MIDERTDILINRKLDGELTEAESLELNKLLIRSPEARALLDEYAHNDVLAAESLAATLGASELARPDSPIWIEPGSVSSRSRHLARRGIALAASIVLAIWIGGIPSGWMKQPVAGPADQTETGPRMAGIAGLPSPAPADPIEGPRRENRHLQKDLFGVYDPETHSIYLIEMDRGQTTVVPVVANY